MELYFNRKSLSHFKVDEESRTITVHLIGGDSFTAKFDYTQDFESRKSTLLKMFATSNPYCGVAWYSDETNKIYFG